MITGSCLLVDLWTLSSTILLQQTWKLTEMPLLRNHMILLPSLPVPIADDTLLPLFKLRSMSGGIVFKNGRPLGWLS